MVPDPVVQHQHGAWADDYRRQVPTLLGPRHHRHIALAAQETGTVGYIAWHVDPRRRHGEIDILACWHNTVPSPVL